jgi:hypothetical protein
VSTIAELIRLVAAGAALQWYNAAGSSYMTIAVGNELIKFYQTNWRAR